MNKSTSFILFYRNEILISNVNNVAIVLAHLGGIPRRNELNVICHK